MHPGDVASRAPERAAVIMAESSETVTYQQLNDGSNRLANLLRARGLGPGGRIAILLENHPRYLEVVWAAQRAGLYYTSVNAHLTAEEAAYIVNDCGARAVVSSTRLAPTAAGLSPEAAPRLHTRLMLDGVTDHWNSYEAAVAAQPTWTVEDECEGDCLLYSSGTTGRPKGVRRPLTLAPMGQGPDAAGIFLRLVGLVDGDVFLCTGPLYHGAPLTWSMSAQRRGATVVVMERFDAARALAHIERYRVTHSQWVPTMFVRMLKLAAPARTAHDLSSHRAAVHGAAPCPVDVKRQMLDWWGPIVHEYYSCSEGVGATFISASEWQAHPGSVGLPVIGEISILDEEGRDLPPGTPGLVWFSGGYAFRYHNDRERTAAVRNERGLVTVGDVGWLESDGYLHLVDRASRIIISGGVNISPWEVESVLITHSQVLDVAAVGVADADLGQRMVAVVQPVDWREAGPDLEAELIAYTRRRLAAFKCPQSVEFTRELPRSDTGKLLLGRLTGAHHSP
jgi:long-chain acyl-CoA synthetase